MGKPGISVEVAVVLALMLLVLLVLLLLPVVKGLGVGRRMGGGEVVC